FGSGDELYIDFAVKTFRIYLALMTITCLVKMSAVFFQSIGKSLRAVAASLVRDILCFTPLAILLPYILQGKNPGTGVMGVLYAAPIADMVAIVVIVVMTVTFFRNLDKEAEHHIDPELEGTTVIKPSKPGVIITISREHGSGGKQIGKLIAEELGIPFYYKELTALAAQESGLDQEFLYDINSGSHNILHDLYLSTNVVQQGVIAQERIIREIADAGSCVIVGRAADYVLRDHDNVVSVYLHAPKEYRINKVMEMYDDTQEEAAAHVKHSDVARASYYRTISSQTWGDPHNYDLCIDASIGYEKTKQVVCDYLNNLK
ncbi:MAG: cytidylate kinase family protein, partial [Firmicutes bacterium]|nr:cytidylate kinase family protein [Bacillota bacterium]